MLLSTTAIAQAPNAGKQESAYRRIGPIHREIVETSPVAKEVIAQIPRDPRILSPFKIAIRVRIYNTSDHEINFQRMDAAFEVTNIKTGKRPPETQLGCAVDFFSDCYTSRMPKSEDNGYGRKPGLTIKPNEFVESTDLLDSYYELSPGVYSVVSYFCAEKREGPECFKSNRINVTVASGK
jgi:hypothetical protein